MFFNSTRCREKKISSSAAIIKGIADDGGLYIPEEIPLIKEHQETLLNMDYKELAAFIMKKYFTDFEDEELKAAVEKAYDSKFRSRHIAPLFEKNDVYFLELFHGPTLAFKDMALSILPQLLNIAARKEKIKKELVILAATSGDTGKAALEGFADVEGTKIIVFFPQDGVSEIQKLQMTTQEGKNTLVLGIEGNFDDAQNGVKDIFCDSEIIKKLTDKGYLLSSANSINVGRLIPQIVYYYYGYLSLLRKSKIQSGESINIVVPTGNFGNILAAYYAKKMGLPINKLICASNENNVLYDFLNSGIYDKRRELKLTSSPSMDILVSSNLERLLYEISERDDTLIKDLMDKLQKDGRYEIGETLKKRLIDFYGGFASESETVESICKVFKSSGYLMDTHTAVAYSVYEKYRAETGDTLKTIIVSTASPLKFANTVCEAVGIDVDGLDDFGIIETLSENAQIHIPRPIKMLANKVVVHKNTCKREDMALEVQKFLKV